MSDSETRIAAAIEAVARHFSAAWEASASSLPDAWLTIGGERIAVEIVAVALSVNQRHGAARPRLRFDKVALRLIAGLQTALSTTIPDGQAAIIAVTAPIRLAAKTAAAVEAEVLDGFAHKSGRVEFDKTICGNRVRVRTVSGVPKGASKVIGFVHNPEPDPEAFFTLAEALLRSLGADLARPAPRGFTGKRWLVLAADDGAPDIEAWRQVWSQLSIPTPFAKILVVLQGGQVEELSQ